MQLFYVIVGIVVLLWAVNTLNRRRTERLRQSGLYPPPGQGTDEEVERLVALRHKIDAIKLYRQIHGTDLKTAKDAVDAMERRARPGA